MTDKPDLRKANRNFCQEPDKNDKFLRISVEPAATQYCVSSVTNKQVSSQLKKGWSENSYSFFSKQFKIIEEMYP